jgi:hypothetical protein
MSESVPTYQDICEVLEKHGGCLDNTALDYGEPGYDLSLDAKGILFANWNPIPSEVCDELEKHFDMEWSDEWIIDYESGKAYRCQPDSYRWKPYYIMMEDGDIWGGDEIEADPESYVEEYLLNDFTKVCFFKVDLESFGFVLVDDTFENGFHPGQSAIPKTIYKKAQEEFPNNDFIFGDYSSGQFDCSFSLYRRERKEDL